MEWFWLIGCVIGDSVCHRVTWDSRELQHVTLERVHGFLTLRFRHRIPLWGHREHLPSHIPQSRVLRCGVRWYCFLWVLASVFWLMWLLHIHLLHFQPVWLPPYRMLSMHPYFASNLCIFSHILLDPWFPLWAVHLWCLRYYDLSRRDQMGHLDWGDSVWMDQLPNEKQTKYDSLDDSLRYRWWAFRLVLPPL